MTGELRQELGGYAVTQTRNCRTGSAALIRDEAGRAYQRFMILSGSLITPERAAPEPVAGQTLEDGR